MSRVKYATPAMVERAAQECSARARWWANGVIRMWPDVSLLACATSRSIIDGLEDGCLWRDIWAEAEARLREGRLPPGWAWRCPARVADRCDGSCVRFDAAIATAWAPGKGPSL